MSTEIASPAQHYLDLATEREARSRPQEPGFVTAHRAAARARFSTLGFPSTRDEDWRFTSVKPITGTAFQPAPANLPALSRDDLAPWLLPDTWHLVVVNGAVDIGLSQFGELPDGCGYGSLAQSVRTFPPLWEDRWARRPIDTLGGFDALNAALWEDGVFLWLAAGVKAPQPIQILYVAHGEAAPLLHVPRTVIVLEAGAEATIVQTFAGISGDRRLHLPVTEIHLAENTQLDHYAVQRARGQALAVSTTHTWQGEGSRFNTDAISLGGELVRNNLEVELAGVNATCQMNGLFVLDGQRHADFRSIIDHQQPHTTSSQLFKGILRDRSHGVFTGRVIVRPDAQKIVAEQSNPNLLLSEDCIINSQPQLEIYADDVKCAHGATIGQLDEDALFYLQSRGIGVEAAQAILTYAFASDLINRMQLAPLRQQLADILVGELVKGTPPIGLKQLIAEGVPA